MAVTGGAGFLGSQTTKRLLERGEEVVVLDDLSSGLRENLSDLGAEPKLLVGDLRDHSFVGASLRGVEKVYHFGADIGNVAYLHGSDSREQAALRNNLAIDSGVIHACLENNIETFIYASSVSVYPKSEQMGNRVSFKEEDAWKGLEPEGGYGWAKYITEKQLEVLLDIRVGVARIFHAYGPNICMKEDRAQVVASLIRKAIRYPEEDFDIWGDGYQRRAFLYIDDFLDGLFRLERYVEQKGNLTVNLGSTEEVTVKELAESIVKISGKDIPLKFDPSKPMGVLSRLPNLARAEGVLHWRPRTRLIDGLSKTYDWAKRRLG